MTLLNEMLRNANLLLLAPEGESDPPADDSQETPAEDSTPADDSAEGQDDSEPSRPKWLPDDQDDPDAYVTRLQQKANMRSEKFRKMIADEVDSERQAKVPAKPEDYAINLPKTDGEFEIGIDAENPMFRWFQGMAHELGMSQEEFDQGVAGYTDWWISQQTPWSEVEAELGDHAEERMTRVDTWAHQSMDDDAYKHYQTLPATAENIKMFEQLMDANGSPKFNPEESQYRHTMSDAEIRELQANDAYWNTTHPDHPAVMARYNAAMAKKHKGAKMAAGF